MWGLIAEIAIVGGIYAYHRWIDDHPPGLLPGSGAGELPVTTEGSPIPLLYGRCRVRAPVLAFIGNPFAPQFGFSPVGDGPAGYFYFIDMLFVVGVPFYGGGASLSQMYAADYVLTLNNSIGLFGSPRNGQPATPGKFAYNTNNLAKIYGGPGAGGGIAGQVEFFDGRPGQQISNGDNGPDAALTDTQAVLNGHQMYKIKPQNIDATQMPSYRNLAIACLYQWGIGEAPQLTTYGFDVKALSTGTPSDMGQSLPEDADPAAVLYDLMTSPFGKVGLPTDRMDLPSFQAASLTLFNEGHGYSRAIEQSEDATAIIGDVLKQTDGLLYEEPTTGKIVYKLIRNDYNVLTLDDINPDNASPASSNWFQIQGWTETANQVRLSFTDRAANYTEGVVIGQNSANVTSQRARLRSIDIRFVGCCDRVLAQKLASRELAVVSRPIAKATMIVNRSFYAHRPGDVVTLTWPELGISKMVMRIARVNLGQHHAGQITLDLIRDVFDVGVGAFG
jgi:Putative phage tail protein